MVNLDLEMDFRKYRIYASEQGAIVEELATMYFSVSYLCFLYTKVKTFVPQLPGLHPPAVAADTTTTHRK